MENNNPFARVKAEDKNKVPQLGEITNIPDTYEEDLKKIENLIPQPGDKSVEEGFKKMMNILEKQAPKMGDPTPGETKETIFSKVTQTKKAQSKTDKTKKDVIKEQETPVKETLPSEQKDKTVSEQLGLNYKDEEILPLLDSIMLHGYASETTTLRGHQITFRTTFSWEDQEIILRMDKKISNGDFSFKQTGSYFYDLYSLAATLERFGDNYFEPIPKGSEEERSNSFTERIEFLSGLASPFITILVKKREAFLKKIQYLSDNYDRLLQAF